MVDEKDVARVKVQSEGLSFVLRLRIKNMAEILPNENWDTRISIAFPAIGTGVGGYSMLHCAEIMLTAAIDFLQSNTSVQLVRFVLFDAAGCSAFEQILDVKFTAKKP